MCAGVQVTDAALREIGSELTGRVKLDLADCKCISPAGDSTAPLLIFIIELQARSRKTSMVNFWRICSIMSGRPKHVKCSWLEGLRLADLM